MTTSNTNTDNVIYEDEIDLRQLFEAIWKGKIFIILMTTIVAISSIFYALSLTNYFTSEAVLVSRDSQTSSPISQFSDIASLAGLGAISGQGNETLKMVEIIKSRDFVRHLVSFDGVLPSLMAYDRYDFGEGRLYFNEEEYDAAEKKWVRESTSNKSAIPTYLEAHQKYGKMLSIKQDKITGFVNISFEHVSPVFAERFLSLIIKEANNLNRQRDISDSKAALEYLTNELSRTSKVDIKNSINLLIEGQLEIQMMASIHDEYSLIILEPPFVPEKRSRPTRSLIVIISTLLGGIISVILVLLRHFSSSK